MYMCEFLCRKFFILCVVLMLSLACTFSPEPLSASEEVAPAVVDPDQSVTPPVEESTEEVALTEDESAEASEDVESENLLVTESDVLVCCCNSDF